MAGTTAHRKITLNGRALELGTLPQATPRVYRRQVHSRDDVPELRTKTARVYQLTRCLH